MSDDFHIRGLYKAPIATRFARHGRGRGLTALGTQLVVCFFLSGCALPIPIQIVSWAIDGISYLATDKSILDHGISTVSNQDCATFRIVTDGVVCRVTIADEVKKAILSEDSLESAEISVETFKGVVQLSGFVDSQAGINRAVAITRNIRGVTSVKNDMQLRDISAESDPDLPLPSPIAAVPAWKKQAGGFKHSEH